MYYLNGQLLYLVPVAALLAAVLVFANYRRTIAARRAFGEWRLLSSTSNPLAVSRYVVRGVMAALAAACLMYALARPVIQDGTKSIAQGTVDVIAVADVSRSMAAMDYEGKVPQSAVARRLIEDGKVVDRKEDTGTRLEMVRHVMLDHLLSALNGNQLGIVSYAGEAFPQAFLTRDGSALRWVIDRGITISSAPGEGSDIGKALELAIAMFDADSDEKHERILILFSDGGNTTEDPNKFVEFFRDVKSRNIKVIVVALGNIMPSKIPVSKLAADDDFAKGLLENGKRWLEINGEIEKTGMDASFLQALANKAGAKFIHLKDATDLNVLNEVGKTSTATVEGTQELFPWALGASLIFLVLSFAATHQWRRRSQS